LTLSALDIVLLVERVYSDSNIALKQRHTTRRQVARLPQSPVATMDYVPCCPTARIDHKRNRRATGHSPTRDIVAPMSSWT